MMTTMMMMSACHVQELGTHAADDVGRPAEHANEPVPDASHSPSDASPAQAGHQEPRNDDGGRQRRAARRRRVPASVPTSSLELLGDGRVQPRRLHLRQNTQERSVNSQYSRMVGSVASIECIVTRRAWHKIPTLNIFVHHLYRPIYAYRYIGQEQRQE